MTSRRHGRLKPRLAATGIPLLEEVVECRLLALGRIWARNDCPLIVGDAGTRSVCLATRELEAADLRAPVKRPAALQVFVRVKEGAVIPGVDTNGTVVSPAIQVP